MSVTARFIRSVKDVPADRWNEVAGNEYPFHRHEFLSALEDSNCVGERSGWNPFHLLLEDQSEEDGNELLAILPLYQKTNSEGEFVFDFAWARAYQQAGLSYFPKLVAGVPFTPATSNCCLIAPGQDAATLGAQLLKVTTDLMAEHEISSLHCLFPTEDEQALFGELGLLQRHDVQFHWHNDSYSDFDDFLSRFKSKKRKQTKRERRKVAEAGVYYEHLSGSDMTDALWDEIEPLYSSTFMVRGRPPYINAEFFKQLSRTLPDAIVVIVGRKDERAVATAVCFRNADTLYGRYWGALERYDSLHFETCYYQGIDYCIAEGLQHFEPGTQGEHKLARGFIPEITHSAHWVSDSRFRDAIAEYLRAEGRQVDDYVAMLEDHTPYKQADSDPS